MSSRRKRERPEATSIPADKPISSLPSFSTRRTTAQTTPASKVPNISPGILDKNGTKSGEEKVEANASQSKVTRRKVPPLTKLGSNKNLKPLSNVENNDNSSVHGQPIDLMATPPQSDLPGDHGNPSQSTLPDDIMPQHQKIEEITDATGEEINPSRLPERREERIARVLSHRRTLLSRIRLCKSAVQSRIDQLTEESKDSPVSKAIQASGSNRKAIDKTTADEVAAFREMTRQANQAAKQQRAEVLEAQQSTEKRTSVSLRRGASVGKKMNAALSSLAPGGGSSTFLPEAEFHPLLMPTPSGVDMNSNTLLPLIPGNSMQQLVPITIKSTLYNPPLPSAPPVAAVVNAQELIQRKRINHTQKSFRSNLPARGNVPASGNLPYQALQGDQTLTRFQSFACPEAMTLRERRSHLRAKLESLYLESEKEMKESTETRATQLDAMVHSHQPTTCQQRIMVTKIPNVKARLNGPSQPSKLPRRRKVQWDYVLEEMRWLASDFIEERKWKLSSSRIISVAVTASVSTLSQAKELDGQKIQTESSVQAMDIDSDEKKEDTSPIKDKKLPSTRQENDSKGRSVSIQRVYFDPTPHDLEASHIVARNLCTLLSGAWELIADAERPSQCSGSANPSENLSGDRSSNRHITIGNDTSATDKIISAEKKSIELTIDVNERENPIALIDVSNEHISKSINSIVEKLERRSKQRSRRPKKSARHVVNLSPEQLKVVDFAEYVWGLGDNAGALVECAIRSETDFVRELLHSSETDGPRLVLCPAVRQFEWRNELNQIDGRRVLTFGQQGIAANFHLQGQKTVSRSIADCIIADFSLLDEVDAHLDFKSFAIIVVDTRATQMSSSTAENGWIGSQFVSVMWWSSLLEKLASTTARRIILSSPIDKVARCNSGDLSEAHRLRFDFLCAQVAFVVGPNCFSSSQKGILRRVLSWAKHESKAELGGKKAMPHLVETKLIKLIDIFRISSDQDDEKKDVSLHLEVRRCRFSNEQKMAYESCCRHVRSALSFKRTGCSEVSLDRNISAADAIEQLRRVCFHSDLEYFRNKYPFSSSSQANTDCAQQILSGSAKLRGLITFLKKDCGIFIQGWNVLYQSIVDEDYLEEEESFIVNEGRKHVAENIAIMCSSPDGQLLTSRLLSALGIEHDTLATTLDGDRPGSSSLPASYRATLAWIKSQLALSKSIRVPHHSQQRFQLLVLSPLSAGTIPFAYGIGALDIIVSIDEDWSGRGFATFHEWAQRCGVYRKRIREKKGNLRLIRLVCKSSLEETIACGMPEEDSSDYKDFELGDLNEELKFWSRDSNGSFVLHPRGRKDGAWKEIDVKTRFGFSFPAMGMLRICHTPLNDVLSAGDSKPTGFLSATSSSFLPFEEFASDKSIYLQRLSSVWDFMLKLLAVEERLSPTIFRSDRSMTSERCHVAACIVPPCGRNFPPKLTFRQDAPFLAIQFYIFDFSARFATLQTASSCTIDSVRKSIATSSEACGVSLLQNDSEFRVSTQAGGLAPDLDATSFLFYINSETSLSQFQDFNENSALESATIQQHVPPTIQSAMGLKRVNLFAVTFANSKIEGTATSAAIGNVESCIYFPPLFPGILLSSKRARLELDVLLSMRKASKRKPPPEDTVNGLQKVKRPKLLTMFPNDSTGTGDQLAESPTDSFQAAHQVPAAQKSHATTLDTVSKAANKYSLVPDADIANISVVSEDETSADDPAFFLLEMNEDYGLLGVGATATMAFSGQEARNSTMDPPQYLQWFDQGGFETDFLEAFSATGTVDVQVSSRFGDFDHRLSSMILFVSKKNAVTSVGPAGLGGGHAGQFPPLVLQGGVPMTTAPYQYPVPAMGNGISIDSSNANGGGALKKPVHPNLAVTAGSSAFSLLPAPEALIGVPTHTAPPGAIGKDQNDIYRSKLLGIVGVRQYGCSLFDAAGFRLASARIRDRVHYRMLASLVGRPDFLVNKGAGLDSKRSKPNWHFSPKTNEWTGIAKRIKLQDDNADHCNSNGAESHRQAPRATMLVPASVDFGPFQTGYCDNPTQPVVDSLSLSTKNGVSLPMGVKTLTYKLDHHIRSWLPQEDGLLDSLVLKYPDNWYLVARGFGNDGKSVRSPRQCKERWEELLNDEALLASIRVENEKNSSRSHPKTRVDPESSDICLSAQQGTRRRVVLLPTLNEGKPALFTAPSASIEVPTSITNSPRTFLAFRLASLKKQSIPMTIPGVVEGQKPLLVASHPSHLQSLQAALASTSSGQSEMWPLQILDVTEKQRLASRNPPSALPSYPAPPATAIASIPSSGHTSRPAYPTPPRSSRPPSSGTAAPSVVSHPAPPANK